MSQLVPKRFFHDKSVLLLVSINSFCLLLIIALVFFRLDFDSGRYIVEYRSNQGLNAFRTGSVSSLLSFLVFSLAVYAFHLVLSMRVFSRRRNFAVVILALGVVLQVMAIVVSNALLLYS